MLKKIHPIKTLWRSCIKNKKALPTKTVSNAFFVVTSTIAAKKLEKMSCGFSPTANRTK